MTGWARSAWCGSGGRVADLHALDPFAGGAGRAPAVLVVRSDRRRDRARVAPAAVDGRRRRLRRARAGGRPSPFGRRQRARSGRSRWCGSISSPRTAWRPTTSAARCEWAGDAVAGGARRSRALDGAATTVHRRRDGRRRRGAIWSASPASARARCCRRPASWSGSASAARGTASGSRAWCTVASLGDDALAVLAGPLPTEPLPEPAVLPAARRGRGRRAARGSAGRRAGRQSHRCDSRAARATSTGGDRHRSADPPCSAHLCRGELVKKGGEWLTSVSARHHTGATEGHPRPSARQAGPRGDRGVEARSCSSVSTTAALTAMAVWRCRRPSGTNSATAATSPATPSASWRSRRSPASRPTATPCSTKVGTWRAARVAARDFGVNSSLLSIDKQGRITLDDDSRRHAGLANGGSVKIAGALEVPPDLAAEPLRRRSAARTASRSRPGCGTTRTSVVSAFEHRPVMRDEIVDALRGVPGGRRARRDARRWRSRGGDPRVARRPARARASTATRPRSARRRLACCASATGR